ncbi:FxLYD domain-containing protein [Phenylobacterium sp.]|uniref:FxLYD domain-containing protein n=1 Tax=Phenylobacterium sp. TaxID=1871053 RepID=UPI0025D6C30D|nr:FxLYD domain-containing protein [Phenylobacterium sp.]
MKQADPEPRPQPAPDPPPEPEPDQPVPAESEPPPDEETAPEVDLAIPRPNPTRAPSRRFGPPARLVWAGFAAVLAITALALALLRDHVVRVWPKTAALYAAAGMSVNGVGLLIEDVRLAPAVQNGQAVLGVSGKIRNERDHPNPAAPLQITLYDAGGSELSRLVANPVDTVPGLESRYFSVLVRNPPPGVTAVALTFVSPGPGPAAVPAARAHD